MSEFVVWIGLVIGIILLVLTWHSVIVTTIQPRAVTSYITFLGWAPVNRSSSSWRVAPIATSARIACSRCTGASLAADDARRLAPALSRQLCADLLAAGWRSRNRLRPGWLLALHPWLRGVSSGWANRARIHRRRDWHDYHRAPDRLPADTLQRLQPPRDTRDGAQHPRGVALMQLN